MCRPVAREARNEQRGLGCGASRRVVLHRSAEREEPIAVKAKPYGRAMRGLDGIELADASTADVGLTANCIGLHALKFRWVCRRPAAAVKPGGSRRPHRKHVPLLAESRL